MAALPTLNLLPSSEQRERIQSFFGDALMACDNFIPALPVSLTPFSLAQLPALRFGPGIRDQLAAHVAEISQKPLIVASPSVLASEFGQQFLRDLKKVGDPPVETVSGEPSPELVDTIVARTPADVDWVIGIGGGSVLDTAKAVAGLLPTRTSVMDYLEGVGAGKPFPGVTIPWLAVPTTAGTGSETTKNAVLSRPGEFKKSFRHDSLLAREAWLDPLFLETLPREVLHSTGMDAFAQLLESYTTSKANPITDALAWHGMQLWLNAFEQIERGDAYQKLEAYGRLMLAASLSGITLANAGLGAVHGLAGPIGAFFEAPHGAVCAALLAPVTAANIRALIASDDPAHQQTLHKYAQVGRLLTHRPELNDREALDALVEALETLNQQYGPGSLARYGITPDTIEPVIQNCRAGSMLGNPVVLPDETLRDVLTHA